jgi:hypothetical protein
MATDQPIAAGISPRPKPNRCAIYFGRISVGLVLLFVAFLVWGCASARAAPACSFAFDERQEQRVALDRAFARGLAAVISDDVPPGAAWALQVNLPGAATALVFITDDRGCLLLSGEIETTLWDAALAILADLAGPEEPTIGYPWEPPPGDPTPRLPAIRHFGRDGR